MLIEISNPINFQIYILHGKNNLNPGVNSWFNQIKQKKILNGRGSEPSSKKSEYSVIATRLRALLLSSHSIQL